LTPAPLAAAFIKNHRTNLGQHRRLAMLVPFLTRYRRLMLSKSHILLDGLLGIADDAYRAILK